jgi:CHAT domain-containing protein
MKKNSWARSGFSSKAISISLIFLSFTYSLPLTVGQQGSAYQDFYEALALKKIYKYNEALKEIDSAILSAQRSGDEHNTFDFSLEKAAIYRLLGQYDSEKALLEELISRNPDGAGGPLQKYLLDFEYGTSLIHTGELEQGRPFIEESILIVKSDFTEADTLLAQSYNKLGNYFLYKRELDSALYYYSLAYNLAVNGNISLHERSIYLVNLGITYSQAGDYVSAEELFKRAIENVMNDEYIDNLMLFKIYVNLGKLYYDVSAFYESLEMYNLAESLIYEKKLTNLLDQGFLFWNKAITYRNFSDINKAKLYIDRARDILLKEFSYSARLMSSFFMDEALIYQAMNNFNEANKLYILSITNSSLLGKIKTYRNLALLNVNQKKWVEAGKFFDTCFMLLKSEQNIPIQEYAYTNLYYGDFINQIGRGDAYQYINSAFKAFYSTYGMKHRDVASTLFTMGDYYFRKNDVQQAIYYYQQALISITPSFNDVNILSNPYDSALSVDQYSVKILEKKADALMVLYLQNGDLSYLTSLLEAYDLITSIVGQFGRLYRNEDARMLLSEVSHDIFKKSLEANLLAFEKTGEIKYMEKAFEMAEKSRAAILLAEIEDENAIKMGLVPEALFQLEKSLRGNMYSYKVHIQDEEDNPHPNAKKLDYMRSSLFSNEIRYDSLLNIYQEKYPDYFRMKYNPRIITVEELQGELNENEVLLEYAISDSNLVIFIITTDGFEYIKNDLDPSLTGKIKSLRTNLLFPNARNYSIDDYLEFQHLANDLYRTLILPVQDKFTGEYLTVIPDGELAYVSFEELTEYIVESDTINFKILPYLINKYTFTYASSSSIYYLAQKNGSPRLKRGVLAMAPTYPLIKRSLVEKYGDFGGILDAENNLPGASEEAETIMKFVNGELLAKDQATEANFKQKASSYDILHFAMHTYIDDKNPQSSVLSFYPLRERPEDDYLHTYEIYSLPLNGHLAVLSACSTGDGKLQKGEGVISLARAFSYAGVPSIIMTLWDVEDIASGWIIPEFYYLLSRGFHKDYALRQAKLHYLKEVRVPIEGHPAFWAGYVLYGNSKPFIPLNLVRLVIILIILGTMIIFISVFLIRRYIKHRKENTIYLNDSDPSS